MKFDMHVHTKASDGELAAMPLFQRAKQKELDGLAITDHDTLAGLAEAQIAADYLRMGLIPGVEISTQCGASVHILGYGVSPKDESLLSFLEKFRKKKRQRIVQILEMLHGIGFELSMDEVGDADNENLGRPHVARAIVKRGWVADKDEAFNNYLVKGKPAYVPREKAGTSEAVQMLASSGAVPVLAHPGLIHMTEQELLTNIDAWITDGLLGIEAFHPAHTEVQCRYWQDFAISKGLLVTAGSDFHEVKPGKLHGELGEMLEKWTNADNHLKKLIQHMQNSNKVYA